MKFPLHTQLATDGTVLYGTTFDGGANDMGIIFKINIDGTGFRKLFDFSGYKNGAHPSGSLILSGTTLYGTTVYGGENNVGVIFKIHTDGSGFCKLLDFDRIHSGALPEGALVRSGMTLYGITTEGGTCDYGVIFCIRTDGTGFRKLFDFERYAERMYPKGALTLSGTTLYGIISGESDYNMGLIFRVNTDGAGFQILSDSDHPGQRLVHNGAANLVHDETFCVGVNGYGVIFRSNKESIISYKLPDRAISNNEIYPWKSLTCWDTELFGIASDGGTRDMGVIFRMNPDGTGVKILCNFDGTNYGAYPYGSLTKAGTSLFGITSRGGVNDLGVIFQITPDGTSFRKIFDFESCNVPEMIPVNMN